MENFEYSAGRGATAEASPVKNRHRLHRLGTVRQLQGVSRHILARRMNVEVSAVRHQEKETSDVPLRVLYQWQKALNVPITELLVEPADALSQPLLQRAQLVRLMKTAVALAEKANGKVVRELTQTLIDQLIEIMPELQGVTAWHSVGERRTMHELGLAASRIRL